MTAITDNCVHGIVKDQLGLCELCDQPLDSETFQEWKLIDVGEARIIVVHSSCLKDWLSYGGPELTGDDNGYRYNRSTPYNG